MYKKGKIHRKIDMSILPHHKSLIDWKNSVGYDVPFEYDNITGFITIVKWISAKDLIISYNNQEFHISGKDICSVKLGKILGIRNYDWKYEIGQEIHGKTGLHGKIVRRYYKETAMSKRSRCYDILCYKCNQILSKLENVVDETGCNICNNGEIRIGFNDLWTTHPHIAEQLHNPEEGYKITYGARKLLDWNCPYCKRLIKDLYPMDIINASGGIVPCECKNDSYSYPNKFIFNLLTELNIDFEFEYRNKEWQELGRRRYDFYIEDKSIIIEADGGQHFDPRFPEIRINDEEKEEIAIRHGIQYYIHIDCSKSNMDYISKNILSSKLSELYDLSNINWDLINYKSNQITLDIVCDLLEQSNYNITVVSQIMKIDRVTISRYLNEMIRSEYLNETEVREKQLQNKIDQHYQLDSKPVFCIEEQLAFGSYSKVKEFLEPRVTKKFSCGSFCQGLSRINGTSYGYHWKRMTREEFNLYKTQNPEKAFGDYFINTE